jgi:hypothetical protein
MSKLRFSLFIGALAMLLTACAPSGPLVLSLADVQSVSGRNRADQFTDASSFKVPDNVEYTLDAALPTFPSEMLSWSLTPAKESRAALERIAQVLNIPGEVVKHERNSFSIGAPENGNTGLWLWVDIGGGWWSYVSGKNSLGGENTISTDDAIARTKSLLVKAEMPTQNFTFSAVKNQTTTEVTGTFGIDTVRSNMAVTFSFGTDGTVLQASGPLFDFKKALMYPLMPAQDAVARLTNDMYASVRTSDVVRSFGQANGRISITGAEATLMQIILNNRSSMLLPAYTFTNSLGEVATVLAVSDQYLSYGDSIVTGGVEPEPSPEPIGPTTTTQPAIFDADPSVLSQETANVLVGLTEANATKMATEKKWIVRIAKRDGEDFMLTMDYVTNRVNLTVVAGAVTQVSIG